MKLHTLPSWVEKGQMVLVEDHVSNVIRDIRDISGGRVEVYWNEVGQEFDLVEKCLDGNQRLVCSVPELDGRVVERLRRADHWYGQDTPTHVRPDGEDFVAEVDAYNEEDERKWMEAGMDQIKVAGEELAWALDVTRDRPSVGGSISVPRSIDG